MATGRVALLAAASLVVVASAAAAPAAGPALSVLRRALAGEATVHTAPYPHVVIPDAIEPAVYARLEAQFPPARAILALDAKQRAKLKTAHMIPNTRYDIRAVQTLSDAGRRHLGPDWAAFVEYHTSAAFYAELVQVFGEALRTVSHPKLEGEVGKSLGDFVVGLREVRNKTRDFWLDCQIGMNSPQTALQSRQLTAVRGPHHDSLTKVFNGLLYMRDPADNVTTGGALEMYECPAKARPPCGFDRKKLVLAKTVPYERNLLVFFLNSQAALHGVTPRNTTPFPRRLLNFVGERPSVATARKRRERRAIEKAELEDGKDAFKMLAKDAT